MESLNSKEQLNVGKSLVIPFGTPLQIEIAGVMAKLRSYSVGFLPEECLILRYPGSVPGLGSITHKLFKGNRVTVRYVDKGNIFAFEAQLLGVITDPVKLIFVSYPQIIARQSLRRSQRVTCSLFAELDLDGVIIDGVIMDISETGCSVTVVTDLMENQIPNIKVGDRFSISFQLPGIEAKTSINGEARNIQRDASRISVGTLFCDMKAEANALIGDFVSTIQKML